MKNLRVLAAYGHPDDEGQVTGALARFIQGGATVTLVCGTRGEVGEISDPLLATPETLGYVRELELRAAMAQIGLADVRLLPYRDSGMAGWEINNDPRCLHMAPAETVVGEMVRIIRDTRPHVIFTWDPQGGYGHPDHIAMHRHTLAAFDASGDGEAYPEHGAPWAPARLYWGSLGMRRFASMFMEMERRGLMTEPIEPERRERFEKALAEPEPVISLVHPCADLAPLKRAAAVMHRSQFGESSMFAKIPDDMRDRFFGEERFYQARPAWPEDAAPLVGLDHLTGLAEG
jgi:LmbE family N-acetylglucosaminyl deacetylase